MGQKFRDGFKWMPFSGIRRWLMTIDNKEIKIDEKVDVKVDTSEREMSCCVVDSCGCVVDSCGCSVDPCGCYVETCCC